MMLTGPSYKMENNMTKIIPPLSSPTKIVQIYVPSLEVYDKVIKMLGEDVKSELVAVRPDLFSDSPPNRWVLILE
mgnify:FL=1